ncbi:uncharacterized protein Tco025E_02805 [Trypanosoma conorhini]|uniref:Uncharacterized protein n=1 Tax=Trypanosoma conorhini TaxID=83891 RepID=A0A422Q0M0_9TRYP|nr:uncharacterized protein Tco025E_02805 [Trypanosoma conorhini]RNF23513.1 hypothetical protein Tco025E_02805 [Trypanosoma conorhini]
MGRFVVSPTCALCVAHASSLSAVKRAAHPSTRTESGSVTPGAAEAAAPPTASSTRAPRYRGTRENPFVKRRTTKVAPPNAAGRATSQTGRVRRKQCDRGRLE